MKLILETALFYQKPCGDVLSNKNFKMLGNSVKRQVFVKVRKQKCKITVVAKGN